MEIRLWEYNTELDPEEAGPPSLIHPEAVKCQASRATVNLPRLRELNDNDDDSEGEGEDGDDGTDEVPEKIWITIGLSRVRLDSTH